MDFDPHYTLTIIYVHLILIWSIAGTVSYEDQIQDTSQESQFNHMVAVRSADNRWTAGKDRQLNSKPTQTTGRQQNKTR